MIDYRLSRLQRFLYSHHLISGVRRAVGVMAAFVVTWALLDSTTSALIAALGALCLAVIDQPGYFNVRAKEMVGGLVLGAATVAVTGLASSYPLVLWVIFVAQTFLFSMFAVYGKRGSVIGLACLLLTIVTMQTSLAPSQVLGHTLISVGGSVIYMAVSAVASRLLQVREQEQSLSVALFATADYIAARSAMYDITTDLDEGYRQLIASQSIMSEEHQAARDMILRSIRSSKFTGSRKRLMVWNIFNNMVNMLDVLVGTHTDYVLLRRSLGKSDTLLFMRDALIKNALEMERIAYAILHERPVVRRNSVKAELRALEFDIESMKRDGFSQREPESYALSVQILRRLRNVSRLVESMLVHTTRSPGTKPLNPTQLDTSLTDFLSAQSFNPRLITSNLRLDSPPFRFALRVSLAVAIGLGLGLTFHQVDPHGYWIVLTIVFIMKPAFSLTQRVNRARVTGTLVGCILAFALFHATDNTNVKLVVMVLSLISGFSLMVLNAVGASIFNTLTVLIFLSFIFPHSFSLVTDRAIDTLIGSVVAIACSYFLPWWEYRSLPSLAKAAIRANMGYLETGLSLVSARTEAEREQAQVLAWPLARRNMLVAYSNFTEGLYRMMREPKSHQKHPAEFNNLLIQMHILAAEIATMVDQLKAQPQPAPEAIEFMKTMQKALESNDPQLASLAVPTHPGEPNAPEWLYPLKQMQRAVLSILQESKIIIGN